MASQSTSTARSTSAARKVAAPAPAAPVTATAPVGATSTTAVGTPAGQVPHLAYLATLPTPITVTAPTAPWAGWGKGTRVQGNGWSGTAYANRGNIDVRVPVAVAAALAKSVPGATVRGAAGNYIRIPFTATGTPQA